jgi:multidrug efflux pump subunit AcrB
LNPIVFAMRHPVTTLMLVVALISGGLLALDRMRVDIFPSLNTPKIYVFLQFGGMSPGQMEGLIVSQFELTFQYVDSVKEVQSRSIQQVALVEISFFPGTDMGQAMGQVVAMANRAMSRMPPGTLPPMVMRMDAGSVPVGYLVMESKSTPLGMLGDIAQNVIRPLVQANVPGTVAVSPFGPNSRSILINVDPDKLRAYNLSPQDVVDSLMSGNVVIPAGNLYIQERMPLVPTNGLVEDIQDLGKIPLKVGRNVYIRDVATIVDGTDVNYGYALVNGKKSVYLPIVKKDTASTLTVVADIGKAMPLFRETLPEDVTIQFEFDESPTVVAAVKSVATEGLIGASLTGLMILLFLRDPRSVLVVVANIPLALLGSMFGLWLTGNTINIMTLGGLALAIGILVDEATVEIENVHAQMRRTPRVATAVLRGNNITAVPRLLALLCILSVFIPAFIMGDPLRSLFLPLTLGVGFAMISSYLLSSTLVPILCVALLKHSGEAEEKEGFFDKIRGAFGRLVGLLVRLRWLVVPAYLAACALVLWQVGGRLGTELFPQVDSGEFVLRFRPPPGSNFELTRQMGVKCLEVIGEEAKAGNVEISMGYVGQVAPNYSMNNIVLFMRGPDDGQLRVALREGSGIRLEEFRERLRKALPDRVVPWLTSRLEQAGLSGEQAHARAQGAIFGFEPGDIVSEVMSFGSPTPIEVRVVGTDLGRVRAHATKVAAEMKKIPFLRDVQFQQTLDYPTVAVEIDREKAGLSGINVRDVGDAVIVATSSSRFIALNYWQNPKTGFDYQVEVLVPTSRMTSPAEVETLPLRQVTDSVNLMVRDIADVRPGTMPGQYDRSASQRFLSITANVEGEDMGRASRQVAEAVAAAGDPPRGVRIDTRGQLGPMIEMFESLAIGLAVAVFVILVLLTAYFQSPRLALISVGSVPGVLSGVAVILYFTGTTLNIESFMGSIMCLGVSVSNSVMLVTFMADHWRGGKPAAEAAILGASDRLRPILMTACAMTVGMVPMALALERGSQMQAPLGRAVIGGLLMSTVATLTILPAIFSLVIGRRASHSVSIYPDDRESAHYDPLAFVHEDEGSFDREAEAQVEAIPEAGAEHDDDREGGSQPSEPPAGEPPMPTGGS